MSILEISGTVSTPVHTKPFHIPGVEMLRLDEKEARDMVMAKKHEPECMERLRDIFSAQLTLFGRPWFCRSWIRQEVGVAQKLVVVCGQRNISQALSKTTQ